MFLIIITEIQSTANRGTMITIYIPLYRFLENSMVKY